MKKIEIIKKSDDFTKIIKEGTYFKNKYFVIYRLPNNLDKNYFGVTISTKAGNAVVRNKFKRRTKNIIDSNRFLFPKGFNYIIMIRAISVEASFQVLSDELIHLLKEKVK